MSFLIGLILSPSGAIFGALLGLFLGLPIAFVVLSALAVPIGLWLFFRVCLYLYKNFYNKLEKSRKGRMYT